MYTMKLIKHKKDEPQGFAYKSVVMIISIMFSLFVQILNIDKLFFINIVIIISHIILISNIHHIPLL